MSFKKYNWIWIRKCALYLYFFSILSHNLGRSSGHHRWIRNNAFPYWPVFCCPSWAGKVHSCPLFDIVFHNLFIYMYLINSNIFVVYTAEHYWENIYLLGKYLFIGKIFVCPFRCNSLSCPPGQLAPGGQAVPGYLAPPPWISSPPGGKISQLVYLAPRGWR